MDIYANDIYPNDAGDYITDYTHNIPILESPYNINNYFTNNIFYAILYDEPTLSTLQYSRIMCFLDEIS